jgi:tripartite-type tricarboxylate transporter receptor subunit TctC
LLIRAAFAAALSATAFAAAAQAWPTKPVRQVISGGAGGPNDTQARAIGQALAPVLGQPFIVENRAGAEGIIALEACAKSPADGHTICSFDAAAAVFTPLLRPKLAVNPERDLTPIIMAGYYVSALAANPSAPFGSVKELIEQARAKPGSIAWATVGAQSSSNLYAEWIRSTYGASFLVVPYKTSPEALAATVSGHVQVTIFALGGVTPQVKSGKLKALAVTSEKRAAQLPDVPSFAETGLEINSRNWLGILAPAGVPREIINRLNTEIARLFVDPAFRDKYVSGIGLEISEPANRPAADFAAFIKADRERAANLLKIAGVKPE